MRFLLVYVGIGLLPFGLLLAYLGKIILELSKILVRLDSPHKEESQFLRIETGPLPTMTLSCFIVIFLVKDDSRLFVSPLFIIHFQWKRFVTGVAPGLQNQWTAAMSFVGSTPIRFRHY